MTKRIIVEGIDGTGKSTLIDNLTVDFINLHPQKGFKHSGIPDYGQFLIHHLVRKEYGDFIPIHDRFFYSELVYGPILRGRLDPALTPPLVKQLSRQLEEEAFLIYCWLPWDELKKYAAVNHQMDGVMANLRAIYEAYEEVMGTAEARHIWATPFNWQKPDNFKKLAASVKEYLDS